MKELDILVENAHIRQVIMEILHSIEERCMKASNTLVDNAVIRQLQKVILFATKEMYTKKLNKKHYLHNFQSIHIDNIEETSLD